jgi:chromosome segregation protein
VLAAVYIKGFKTFARPVRMPLEGGITAIVGPNGSGKSNITDAVLFALGEQSPGVLRAGAMSELIFSGSETLPAAGVAEVTLVVDNASRRVSLPYEEVSLTRRISRGGETEYRINGSRARLTDVRAVAGEAGLGRHSILRQGAVDAIVAGGAAACRQALEEAAGLGVFRRRRLSASRRLEKADAQLEQSRQLEAELAGQLRRIEREAVAAREYRTLEGRYRRLSLAHLYRVATKGLDALRGRLEDARSREAELAGRAARTREEESALARRLADLEVRLGGAELLLEAVEDGGEELRAAASRVERMLYRLEAGAERDPRRSIPRLEAELARAARALADLEGREAALEKEHAAGIERSGRLARARSLAREKATAAERERAQLASRLEGVRARLARDDLAAEKATLSERDLERLARCVGALEVSFKESAAVSHEERLERLRAEISGRAAALEEKSAGIGRRRGALEAAIGRAESRVRALQEPPTANPGPRLYEVLRARPGYEGAVEAALGEYGAGVLARNVEEGLRVLSGDERVAVRLDAGVVAPHSPAPPGRPLLECVEVLDRRYAEPISRLLDGTYVVEEPAASSHVNGYVAVTRDGLRLTRTSVSHRRSGGGFARERRLASALESLDAIKSGPGETLYDLTESAAEASRAAGRAAARESELAALSRRSRRATALLAEGAGRRLAAARRARRERLRREREARVLSRERAELEAVVGGAESTAARAGESLAAAAAAADDARAAVSEAARRLERVRAARSEGEARRAALERELDRARDPRRGPECAQDLLAALASRSTTASTALADALRARRRRVRLARSATAEEHRRASDARNDLAHRAAELLAELGSVRGEAEKLAGELARARAATEAARAEIRDEWGATLETARREAEEHPAEADAERAELARALKRFGDVNLLAISQEEDLRERHTFIAAQRADAEEASAELNRIIESIDGEIEARFSATFRRVREAFAETVPRMMEGASGVLDLSEEGVEVGLRLGRRGWRPLRVLSGGERSLLALSFLFSVFLSRPGGDEGAFCVLDEAEAALDDINLARFLAVVDSHRTSGQYLLVTHQKRTMAAADVLYGVVQDATGSTTVVSKRMQGE